MAWSRPRAAALVHGSGATVLPLIAGPYRSAKSQAKESGFTSPSLFVSFTSSKPTPSGQPGLSLAIARTPEVQMKVQPPGPLAQSTPEPSLTELLRQAMSGLLPASPDVSALFDRMETPR